ncbi:MAG: hypothetical protein CVU42_08235 [Chloroflexi bacterium HGW-Chloroflexi-4]|nr:MAG: hypothetical protein CVU42_08235 [Chloroflexi bacterium HGW-Chloroflexi-4]
MNLSKKASKTLYIFAISAMLIVLAGCSRALDPAASGKTYPISPGLQAFYNRMGGEEVLGPAISKLIENQTGQCQYTVNTLICLNPMVSGDESFSIYALGTELNLNELSSDPASTEGLIINGFTVYEEFVPIFERFSQSTYAGNPISQVHINYAQQRVEQYFEKVGFYRNFSDPLGTVKLLAYGDAGCTKGCSYKPADEAELSNPSISLEDLDLMEKLGILVDKTAFGKSLDKPHTAADGSLEQVYSGVVLFQDATGVVRLRPLSSILAMPVKEPGEKLYDYSSGVVFYAVNDTLGYHVPILFDTFINAHGGTAISGDPINEVYEYEPGLFRQCFTNYCLDYDPSKHEDRQVSITQLGKQYLAMDQTVLPQPATPEPEPPAISLQVSETLAKVSSSDAQTIHVTALNAADQTPLTGIETEITLFLPKEKTWTSLLAPTAVDGTAVITLPVLKNIHNGSILAYKVCTTNASISQSCATGTYLIWTAP